MNATVETVGEDSSLISGKTDPILLIAATRWETVPVAKQLELSPSEAGRQYEGKHAGRRIVLVQTGIGPEKTMAALSGLTGRYACAVSTGYAGALQPGMRPGDVVLDLRGADLDAVEAARTLAAELKIGVHFGRVIHSDRVLGRPEDKRALGSRERASAVDMETQALRDWALPLELPVYSIRAVIDAADESLPEEVPGDEGLPALLRYALSHPGDLPALALMGLRQRRLMPRYCLFLSRLLPAL